MYLISCYPVRYTYFSKRPNVQVYNRSGWYEEFNAFTFHQIDVNKHNISEIELLKVDKYLRETP